MSEYKLDFTKDTIIVDGHLCRECEIKGYYKVLDNYIVDNADWSNDISNRRLIAYGVCLDDDYIVIKYIANIDDVDENKDLLLVEKYNIDSIIETNNYPGNSIVVEI